MRDRVRRVFGIANFSCANRGPHDFDALAAAILDDLGDRDAVVVSRVSARAPTNGCRSRRRRSSARSAGCIKEAKGWRVDLDDPALTIHLEMLPEHAFYFFGKEPGAGGMPTGTGGRVACLLSGGIDSPVAAYRMMRRGCSVLLIHFHSYPILSRASQEKVREIAALLTTAPAAIAARAACRSASCSSRSCSPCLAELRVVIYRPADAADRGAARAEAGARARSSPAR